MIAARRAPGLGRTFGFQRLAWYDGPTWQRIRQQAHDRLLPDPAETVLFASDRDDIALHGPHATRRLPRSPPGFGRTRRCARTRGTGALGHWSPIRRTGSGSRIGCSSRPSTPRLGDALKARFAGWTAWFLTGDLRLPKLIGLKAAARIPLFNGAIECRLFGFDWSPGGISGSEVATGWYHRRDAHDPAPAMPMLPARHYISDHTRFMRELMEKRTHLAEQQRVARAIWWDKDPRELARQTATARSRGCR